MRTYGWGFATVTRKNRHMVFKSLSLAVNITRSKLFRSFMIRGCLMMSSSPSSDPEPKRMCDMKTIGTHSGHFHCDEALACYMLKLLPEYKDARILRTRDPALLKGCDIVVDVGGEYNPTTHRYDHHQRTFAGSMSSLTGEKKPWVTKLSSAGLVYLHFGHRVISTITGIDQSKEEGLLEELYDRVYANFVEEVDAVDNGISAFDGTPRYLVTTSIGYRVSRLNPSWNDSNKDFDGQFQLAMELVGGEFTERIMVYKNVWLPARTIVKRALESRLQLDESGEIIRLEQGCPWKEHLHDLEVKLSLPGSIVKFVLYKEEETDKWRVQAVPVHSESFVNRLSLPAEWCGVRDEQLSQVSGIPGCVFVHANGFIGGNLTYQGALTMAKKTLQMRTSN